MPAVCNSLLDDIEDIVSAQDLKPYDQQFRRKNVVPKVRKRSLQKNVEADDDPPSDRYSSSFKMYCLIKIEIRNKQYLQPFK